MCSAPLCTEVCSSYITYGSDGQMRFRSGLECCWTSPVFEATAFVSNGCGVRVIHLSRCVRHREPLLMAVMLAHIAQTGCVQIPLLAKQLDAATLTDPLWIARVTSIEARPCARDSCSRHMSHLAWSPDT